MMDRSSASALTWSAIILGGLIGLVGFFVSKVFLTGISNVRLMIIAFALIAMGVSGGLALLWSTLPLKNERYKKSGVFRGLMGVAGGVGVLSWAIGLDSLIWFAGALTLIFMRMANSQLRRSSR